jgi:hypothetical protein
MKTGIRGQGRNYSSVDSSGASGRRGPTGILHRQIITTLAPNSIAALIACAALGGCAGLWDIHGPKTVVANANGGAVTVEHGDRLRVPLTTENGYEWRRVEPRILTIVAEGPSDGQGLNFTPVRTGTEQLRLEYRPLTGDAAAQLTVSYDVTVPEDAGMFSSIWNTLRGNRRKQAAK